MAKDPALLFYTSDFLSTTQGLSLEEIGMLIKLLCIQHQNGHLSKKAVKLAVGEATEDVLSFFKLDENGLYYSERLDTEISKRKKFTESRRKNAQKRYDTSASAYASAGASALHMENENENVNVNVNENVNDNEIENKNINKDTIKGLYGVLSNVKLTEGEYEAIKSRFPRSYKRYIDDLSYYIEKKGDKYKSHYATILEWNRDKPEEMSSFDTDDFFEAALKRSAEHIRERARST